MSGVPTVLGLQSALKLYASDKVKERTEGSSRIRAIFSDRENLHTFQETARRDGGAGWVALFQCLFQVVVLEKKAWLKKNSGAQSKQHQAKVWAVLIKTVAERRLADAISLVRWLAERSVHLLSRKPFLSLFTHMTHLLVYASEIFRPAALDYAKALRSLLSYPPHLDNLDEKGWRLLVGICWADALGEPVTLDDEWDEISKLGAQEFQLDERDEVEDSNGHHLKNGHGKVASTTAELVTLIPILLSSSIAPLVPPLPATGHPYAAQSSLGFQICDKINRYLSQRQSNEAVQLNVLKALNMVLESLELNCRADFVAAGGSLCHSLADLWTTSSRPIREQVLVALRFFVPYLNAGASDDANGIWLRSDVYEVWEKISDQVGRERSSRGGISSLDLDHVRLRIASEEGSSRRPWSRPFETEAMTATLGFSHDMAMSWAGLELYADVHVALHAHMVSITSPEGDYSRSKRRKTVNPMASLVSGCTSGTLQSRILFLQSSIFVVHRHISHLSRETLESLRQTWVDLLEEEIPALQDWSLLALTHLAVNVSASLATPALWDRAWTHAVRKAFIAPQSRTACYLAAAILSRRLLPLGNMMSDVEALLRNIDIQGPSNPSESLCSLVDLALHDVKNDTRLYSAGLEDKVIAWMGKWNFTETSRGK